MKITIIKGLDTKQDVLILGMFEEETSLKNSSPGLQKELQGAMTRKAFEKKFGQLYISKNSMQPVTAVLGLGAKKDFTIDKIRRALGKCVRFTQSQQLSSFSTNIISLAPALSPELIGRAVAEGLLLSEYCFKKYLGKEKKEKKKELAVVSVQYPTTAAFERGVRTGRIISEVTNYARDLVNEPAGVATTLYLEKAARTLAGPLRNVQVKVMNKEELEKEGLHALVGVGRGSATPPKLVFLEYKGGGNGKWTAIVGKGITFDSGGYNLKPTHYIEDMHSDMAGAAAVLATIRILAELGVKKNVVGVMALAENMVSSTAQHPGDIVTAYNGKTIQIGNTDAEGRLVLSDALCYTEDKYKPEVMVDLATLTGACVVALGYYASGMVGNDEGLQVHLFKAGEESGDRVWKFPFFEEYQDWMDGDITDLKNVSVKGKGYEAGSITGGVFLSKFVDKAKWAHIDIAGPAYLALETDYLQKYATGAGVRVLSYYFLQP